MGGRGVSVDRVPSRGQKAKVPGHTCHRLALWPLTSHFPLLGLRFLMSDSGLDGVTVEVPKRAGTLRRSLRGDAPIPQPHCSSPLRLP